MTGDQALIAMRRKGVNPEGVWVIDSDDHYSRTTARAWPENRDLASGHQAAHLRIETADIPDALDFRCVVGLTCHVASDRGESRFDRIFEALLAAGAAVVVGVHNDRVRLQRQGEEAIYG